MTFAGQFDEATSRKVLDKAVGDQGVTSLDTADCYPIPIEAETAGLTEEVIVAGWRITREKRRPRHRDEVPAEGGSWAERFRGLSRRHIFLVVRGEPATSSGRPHRPVYRPFPGHGEADYETLRAFDDLVRSGKVRYIGLFQLCRMADRPQANGLSENHGWSRFDCLQPRLPTCFYREIETEVLPYCRDSGVAVIVYNPMAGGLLTGKQPARRASQARHAVHPGGLGRPLNRERYWHSSVRGGLHAANLFSRAATSTRDGERRLGAGPAGVTSAIVGASPVPRQLDATLSAPELSLDADRPGGLRKASGGPYRDAAGTIGSRRTDVKFPHWASARFLLDPGPWPTILVPRIAENNRLCSVFVRVATVINDRSAGEGFRPVASSTSGSD